MATGKDQSHRVWTEGSQAWISREIVFPREAKGFGMRRTVPWSCCRMGSPGPCLHLDLDGSGSDPAAKQSSLSQDDCASALLNWIRPRYLVVGSLCILLALIQLASALIMQYFKTSTCAAVWVNANLESSAPGYLWGAGQNLNVKPRYDSIPGKKK